MAATKGTLSSLQAPQNIFLANVEDPENKRINFRDSLKFFQEQLILNGASFPSPSNTGGSASLKTNRPRFYKDQNMDNSGESKDCDIFDSDMHSLGSCKISIPTVDTILESVRVLRAIQKSQKERGSNWNLDISSKTDIDVDFNLQSEWIQLSDASESVFQDESNIVTNESPTSKSNDEVQPKMLETKGKNALNSTTENCVKNSSEEMKSFWPKNTLTKGETALSSSKENCVKNSSEEMKSFWPKNTLTKGETALNSTTENCVKNSSEEIESFWPKNTFGDNRLDTDNDSPDFSNVENKNQQSQEHNVNTENVKGEESTLEESVERNASNQSDFDSKKYGNTNNHEINYENTQKSFDNAKSLSDPSSGTAPKAHTENFHDENSREQTDPGAEMLNIETSDDMNSHKDFLLADSVWKEECSLNGSCPIKLENNDSDSGMGTQRSASSLSPNVPCRMQKDSWSDTCSSHYASAECSPYQSLNSVFESSTSQEKPALVNADVSTCISNIGCENEPENYKDSLKCEEQAAVCDPDSTSDQEKKHVIDDELRHSLLVEEKHSLSEEEKQSLSEENKQSLNGEEERQLNDSEKHSFRDEDEHRLHEVEEPSLYIHDEDSPTCGENKLSLDSEKEHTSGDENDSSVCDEKKHSLHHEEHTSGDKRDSSMNDEKYPLHDEKEQTLGDEDSSVCDKKKHSSDNAEEHMLCNQKDSSMCDKQKYPMECDRKNIEDTSIFIQNANTNESQLLKIPESGEGVEQDTEGTYCFVSNYTIEHVSMSETNGHFKDDQLVLDISDRSYSKGNLDISLSECKTNVRSEETRTLENVGVIQTLAKDCKKQPIENSEADNGFCDRIQKFTAASCDLMSIVESLYRIKESPAFQVFPQAEEVFEETLFILSEGAFSEYPADNYLVKIEESVLYISKDSELFLSLNMKYGEVAVGIENTLKVDNRMGRCVYIKCDFESMINLKTEIELHCLKHWQTDCLQLVHYPLKHHENIIIIDLGSSSTRAGILMDQPTLPSIFFPTICATNRETGENVYGMEALQPEVRQHSNLSFPCRPSMKITKHTINIDLLEGLFKKIFLDLQVNANEYTVLVCLPRNLSIPSQTALIKLLLEKLKVKSVTLANQALLTLYAHDVSTAVVVNIGDRTEVLPVVDGFIVETGMSKLPYGGQSLIHHMKHGLAEKHVNLSSDIDSYVVQYIIENLAYVASDYETEMQLASQYPNLLKKTITLQPASSVNSLTKTITLDEARFKVCEGLFDPELWGLDSPGIHHLINKAIQATGVDVRKKIAENIYISGGVTMIPGFIERLHEEVAKLSKAKIVPKVFASNYRYHCTYIGACKFAKMEVFTQVCISSEEFSKNGISTLKKCALCF